MINSVNPAAKKVELARAKVQDEYRKIAEMNMVAGGAQAEEYYEGSLILCYISGYKKYLLIMIMILILLASVWCIVIIMKISISYFTGLK